MDSDTPDRARGAGTGPAQTPASTKPAWHGRLGGWTATALQLGVFVFAGFFCARYADTRLETPLVGALLCLALIYPCTLVHELGHWWAAWLAGMKVVRMRVAYLEVMPLRRGLKMRWRRRVKGEAAGAVVAFADPAKRGRLRQMAFMAGGPAANALAAGALWLAIGPLADMAWGWLAVPAMVMNLAFAAGNLVPRAGARPSDGMWLWRLLCGRAQAFDAPQYRIIALTLFGRTAERLPEDDLAALEAQPFPFSLVGRWFRLKAHMNRGEWGAAVAMREAVEASLAAADARLLAVMRSLIACMRTELAFAQAMHARDAGVLVDGLMPGYAIWEEPHLWPRCLALRAALAGDRDTYARRMAESEALARDSVDESLAASEAMIRGHMEASLGRETRMVA